jgi:signal transduction histidine kinase
MRRLALQQYKERPMITEAHNTASEPASAAVRATAPAVSNAGGAALIRLYRRLWRAVPGELGFLILAFPVALVAFILSLSIVSFGVSSLVLIFGIFVVVGGMYAARGFGTLELYRLQWAGQPRIERPEWQDGRAQQGFGGWLRGIFANGHYWLYLLHSLVINFVVSLVTWTLTVIAVAYLLGGLTGWIWMPFLPEAWQIDESDFTFTNAFLGIFGQQASGGSLATSEHIIEFVFGMVLALLLPFITHGLVLVHQLIARGVLGSFKSDGLQREIIALNASRGAAVSAEGHSLRRLERDIHDGPQQRLVRLQMDLSAAQRQVEKDPQKAQTLISEAMGQAKDALEELRALSRGFAPPILLDRGLVAALESAAIRSTIPTRVVSELPDSDGTAVSALPNEIERNAYFVASEAIVNAAKHSGASQVDVLVSLVVPDGDHSWLLIVVSDNGRGGALLLPGHGLAGLDERLRGLGGVLEVSSPEGGPTRVTAHLPLTASMPGSA